MLKSFNVFSLPFFIFQFFASSDLKLFVLSKSAQKLSLNRKKCEQNSTEKLLAQTTKRSDLH